MAQRELSSDRSDEEISEFLKVLASRQLVSHQPFLELYQGLRSEAADPDAAGRAFIRCLLELLPEMARERAPFARILCETTLPSIVGQDLGLIHTFALHGLAVLPDLASANAWVAKALEKAAFNKIWGRKELEPGFLVHGGAHLCDLAEVAPKLAARLARHLMSIAKAHDEDTRRDVQHDVFTALPALAAGGIWWSLRRVVAGLRSFSRAGERQPDGADDRLPVAKALDGAFINAVFDTLSPLAEKNPAAAAVLLDSSLIFIKRSPGDRQAALTGEFTDRAKRALALNAVTDPDVLQALEEDLELATTKKPSDFFALPPPAEEDSPPAAPGRTGGNRASGRSIGPKKSPRSQEVRDGQQRALQLLAGMDAPERQWARPGSPSRPAQQSQSVEPAFQCAAPPAVPAAPPPTTGELRREKERHYRENVLPRLVEIGQILK